MILHVTSKCNLSCSFCFAKPTENDIGLEDWKNICRKNTTRDFHISGGEPLVVWEEITKPLIEYIQNVMYSKKYHKIDISSNGTLLTDEIATFLKKGNIGIWISLHGDKSYMESINSDYDKVIAGLNILKKHDLPIHIKMMANKNNVEQINFIRSLAIEYNSQISIIQRCFGDDISTNISSTKETQIVTNKDL